MDIKDEFKLQTNIERQLELLGDRLYKEPFLSGLKEAIKNSIEEGASSVEVLIDGLDKTIVIERGGKGINPATFKETIGTIFTKSKDKEHFGIGRLGLILSHTHTDYLTIWNKMLFRWRIYSDGSVREFVPELANKKDFSVRIIGYKRKKNHTTEKQITEYLEQHLGLILTRGIPIQINNIPLSNPLGKNPEKQEFKFHIKGKPYIFSVFWNIPKKPSPDFSGFSVICENGIGVRKRNVTGIIIYFDQNGYLKTVLNREDFQRDTIFDKFLKEVRQILKDKIPRKTIGKELIYELWKRIYPLIKTELYKVVVTEKRERKNNDIIQDDRARTKDRKTRLDVVDEGELAPYLWFDRERQYFEQNESHPVTILLVEKHRSRSGRMDVLALPTERCHLLLELSKNNNLDWDELKKSLTESDNNLGKQLRKVLRKHRTVEEQHSY